jgi:hypothetical protein
VKKSSQGFYFPHHAPFWGIFPVVEFCRNSFSGPNFPQFPPWQSFAGTRIISSLPIPPPEIRRQELCRSRPKINKSCLFPKLQNCDSAEKRIVVVVRSPAPVARFLLTF